jgi:hypothetical protein
MKIIKNNLHYFLLFDLIHHHFLLWNRCICPTPVKRNYFYIILIIFHYFAFVIKSLAFIKNNGDILFFINFCPKCCK